jgi:AraC-like DNA-binding protein
MSNTVARIRTDRSQRRTFSKAILYQGILSRVAQRLGLSRSHVYRIAIGQRQSSRVEAALLAEMKKIERKCAA